jgi:hypothetical protein
MKFVAYERGTQRILFRNLEVDAPAVVWRYSRYKDSGYSSAASKFGNLEGTCADQGLTEVTHG